MFRSLIFVSVMIFLGIKVYHYTVIYEVINLEKEFSKLGPLIVEEIEKQNLLEAEWAILTSPENLKRLAEKNSNELKLEPIRGDQITVSDSEFFEGE